MMRPDQRPIITFERDGEAVELGRSADAPLMHLHGTEGIGLPPTDLSLTSRLAADGSRVRGVRYGDREVFIPVLAHASTPEGLTGLWQDLLDHLAPDRGPLMIRVRNPLTGTDRSISGYLKEGMEGSFGGSFNGFSQKFGLTFTCPDPWWLGRERLVELQIAPGMKPFLSESVPFFPVVLAQSALVDSFGVTIRGVGEVSPEWEIVGPGRDVRIENDRGQKIDFRGNFAAGSSTRIDVAAGRIVPDSRWDELTLDSDLFALRPGSQQLRVSMSGATPETLVRLVYRERYRTGY